MAENLGKLPEKLQKESEVGIPEDPIRKYMGKKRAAFLLGLPTVITGIGLELASPSVAEASAEPPPITAKAQDLSKDLPKLVLSPISDTPAIIGAAGIFDELKEQPTPVPIGEGGIKPEILDMVQKEIGSDRQVHMFKLNPETEETGNIFRAPDGKTDIIQIDSNRFLNLQKAGLEIDVNSTPWRIRPKRGGPSYIWALDNDKGVILSPEVKGLFYPNSSPDINGAVLWKNNDGSTDEANKLGWVAADSAPVLLTDNEGKPMRRAKALTAKDGQEEWKEGWIYTGHLGDKQKPAGQTVGQFSELSKIQEAVVLGEPPPLTDQEALSVEAQKRVERAKASRVRQREGFPVSFSMKEALIEAAPWMTNEQMDRFEVFVDLKMKDLQNNWIAAYFGNQRGEAYFKLDIDFIKNSASWKGVEEEIFSDPIILKWWIMGSILHEGDHVIYKKTRGISLLQKLDPYEIEPPAYRQKASFLRQAGSYERSKGNEEVTWKLEDLAAAVDARLARGFG